MSTRADQHHPLRSLHWLDVHVWERTTQEGRKISARRDEGESSLRLITPSLSVPTTYDQLIMDIRWADWQWWGAGSWLGGWVWLDG